MTARLVPLTLLLSLLCPVSLLSQSPGTITGTVIDPARAPPPPAPGPRPPPRAQSPRARGAAARRRRRGACPDAHRRAGPLPLRGLESRLLYGRGRARRLRTVHPKRRAGRERRGGAGGAAGARARRGDGNAHGSAFGAGRGPPPRAARRGLLLFEPHRREPRPRQSGPRAAVGALRLGRGGERGAAFHPAGPGGD